jgi:DNA-binding MarR family transcriptional regulator
MTNSRKFDFGAEMSGILPLLLREVIRKHEMVKLGRELTPSDIAIIDLLNERGACRMTLIASMLNLTMGAVTGIIDKMVASGLVKRERSSSDRRVVKVILLKKGQEVAKRVKKMRRDVTNEIYAVLSEKEKQTYVTLLKKVYNNLERRQ